MTAKVAKTVKLSDPVEKGTPFVVQFDTTPPDELLSPPGPKRQARITALVSSASPLSVAAETPRVLFQGRAAAPGGLPLRCAIGVRDKASGEIVLVEVPPVVALSRSVKVAKGTKKDSTAYAVDADLAYGDKRNLLTEVFGNRRKKIQMKAQSANALPSTVADVQMADVSAVSAAADAAAASASGETAQSDPLADLPVLDTAATKADDAYPLAQNVSMDAWDEAVKLVDGIAETLDSASSDDLVEALEKVGAPVCNFVRSRLRFLATDSNQTVDSVKSILATLLLINDIVAFDSLPLSSIRTNKSLEESGKRMNVSKEMMMELTQRFLDHRTVPGAGTQYSRTNTTRTKLANHVAVLALSTDNWTVGGEGTDLLAKDLRIDKARFVLHLDRVGCKTKRVQTSKGNVEPRHVLVVPVVPSVAIPKPSRHKSNK